MKYTNKSLKCFAGILLLSVLPLRAQKNVIFDTDMGPDCDDAGALAILHAMADKGEANILAIASCISNVNSAPTIEAINTYYGRPNIPVGALKDVGFLEDTYSFIKDIAANFPNTLKTGANAPDAVKLYRQTLAAQPDNSVTLIAVGPLRNIRNLLQSAPDSYSDLNGIALVAKKVKTFTLMGGVFGSGTEWNMKQDGNSAEYVINNFPPNIEVTFSQMHIGSAIPTGARLSAETPVTNPVRRAYEIYSGVGKNNASWDQTAVLYAIRGLGPHWSLETNGYCYIDGTGFTEWRTQPDKNHSQIKWITNAQSEMAVIIEDLMVQPPKNAAVSNPVTSVALNMTSSPLAVGQSLSLEATISPSNATNKGVVWSSSNTAVALVSTNGVVTGVGPGTAIITVTTQNSDKKATCAITATVLGSVTAEYWTEQAGTAIPAKMPTTAANQTKEIYSLNVPFGFSSNYLVRIRGYMKPNTTGVYNFYISSNDNGSLWLSTSEDTAKVTKIASVEEFSEAQEWNKTPNQKSANTTLVAGSKYYFEAIMKQGTGADHLAVGWTGPGISTVSVIGGGSIEKYIGGSSAIVKAKVSSRSFSLHPNPARSEFFVSGNFSENAQYEITNLKGKALRLGLVGGGNIPVSNFKTGIYIIKIKAEDGDRLKWFVKE